MANYTDIQCNICKRSGGIGPGKLRKFSGPVVAIGYIFLIPSVLGMVLGAIMLFSVCSAASQMEHAEGATGVAGGIVVFFMVGSFVGGLLGWLLTMNRKVLLCGFCRGVHA